MLEWESKAEAESAEFKEIAERIGDKEKFKAWEYPKVFFWLKKFQEQRSKPLRVMDFGCGFSSFPQFLAMQGFEVWGVDDNSHNTMDRANKDSPVNYYVGNILNLDEKFDAIVSCSVIEHITEVDVDLIFPKMRELLGKDGKMCHVIDHYFPDYGRRMRVDFTKMAKKFGFSVDETMCPEHPDFVAKSMDKIDFMFYPHRTGLFMKPARREARILIGDDV